jgi:hypothetical protein
VADKVEAFWHTGYIPRRYRDMGDGSFAERQVAAIEDASGQRINPAKEDGNLASILAQLDITLSAVRLWGWNGIDYQNVHNWTGADPAAALGVAELGYLQAKKGNAKHIFGALTTPGANSDVDVVSWTVTAGKTAYIVAWWANFSPPSGGSAAIRYFQFDVGGVTYYREAISDATVAQQNRPCGQKFTVPFKVAAGTTIRVRVYVGGTAPQFVNATIEGWEE